jgi:hypothetical protein
MGFDEDGWGMMGPSMMQGWYGGTRMGGGVFGPLGWFWGLTGILFPLGFLALLILGAIWLFRQVSASPGTAGAAQGAASKPCPNCGRTVQAGWQYCPSCGHSLVAPSGALAQPHIERLHV